MRMLAQREKEGQRWKMLRVEEGKMKMETVRNERGMKAKREGGVQVENVKSKTGAERGKKIKMKTVKKSGNVNEKW